MNYQSFTNKRISEIAIGYDWSGERHYAQITLFDNAGEAIRFRINGLTEYMLYDDFQARYIERYKLVVKSNFVYLSLDAADDTNIPDIENDCLCFHGETIEEIVSDNK